MFRLGHSLISWTTKKQNYVILSTTEAEPVALCSSVSEDFWSKKSYYDLNIKQIVFLEENQRCIFIITNPRNNGRVKNMEICL